ncbi:dihydropyrimidine dehydrogenase, partial [Salmonella enterica subsp. enterica serovar Newport]|nr:dihydropyrimidine dehydrogenase [Salmonella enterica subsp. enterica serovar Newport]
MRFALIYSSIKEDYMPQQNYLDELTPGFTPLLAIKEASRCLLC